MASVLPHFSFSPTYTRLVGSVVAFIPSYTVVLDALNSRDMYCSKNGCLGVSITSHSERL